MLNPAIPQFRRRRGGPRKTTATSPPGPAQLTLVSASYNESGGPAGEALLILEFDRPINIGGLVPSAIAVNDAQFNNYLYNASGTAQLLNPSTLELLLTEIDNASGTGVKLTAAAANGIVAAGDGAAWAGVSNLPLPFP